MSTLIGLAFFAAVAFSCRFGRPGGGVAMVWVASAVLAACLLVLPRRAWPGVLGACAFANLFAGGWFGLGWAAQPWLTVANLAEAVAAAELARHALDRHWPRATLEMVSLFLLGAALVIPAGSGAIAAIGVQFATGIPAADTFAQWLPGHAVGLIAILPFGALLARRLVNDDALIAPQRRLVSLLILGTMALLVWAVFAQFHGMRWPLVAPLLFALFAAIWADALVATAMPMLVALIAAPLTLAGAGPIAQGLPMAADRLQLGLIYAGLVALCSLPVVAEQARRRHELAQLSRNADHFRALSERADGLIDELRRAALTDVLTGLANRRAFFDSLAEQLASGRPACVAMIDIDHFKQVNDQYGHAAGDAVLVQFAELARSILRSTDMVARIGGEEFAVIVRDVTIEQGCAVCQRLVDRLAAAEIHTPQGLIQVTISTGIATVTGDCDSIMAAADRALYDAKRSGRARLSAVA